MVTTVTDNSPQAINTSLFSLEREIQEVTKGLDNIASGLKIFYTKGNSSGVKVKVGIFWYGSGSNFLTKIVIKDNGTEYVEPTTEYWGSDPAPDEEKVMFGVYK